MTHSARNAPASSSAAATTPAATPADAADALIETARQHCKARGTQLTPLRVDVLRHLARSPGGIKAYDLLTQIQKEKPGFAPMSLYRTLDFLVDNGLVHKVDATSSFIICEHGHHDRHDHGHPIMLICEGCGQVSEYSGEAVIEALAHATSRIREQSGFRARGMEIKGLCQSCSDNVASHDPSGH
ncbi:MAG: transcriptional repressor [Lautropia sp.]|nr:transcriptional repressor [Lautropia sp.]